MKGLIIGGLGIFHVFLAQFAIGGGMLMCYFQWLGQSGRDRLGIMRKFIDDYFKYLVLICFVTGALTGVGMWFTSIQISPRTIGLMVTEFHWLWATEWTFFCLEVVAGYAFFRHGKTLPDSIRLQLLLTYTIAAWFSLFWINGILSWQLTPGTWTQSRNVWDGFFNPSFWPSLLFRTIVCMVIAALSACVVINTLPLPRETRSRLIFHSSHFLLPMIVMPALGLWFVAVLPVDSRQWVMGGSVAITLFMNIAVGASVLIAGYAIVGLYWQRLTINGATATLLLLLAFGATAGGEFVREGVRKPYTVRQTLYSNSMTPNQITEFRQVGSVTNDPYPLLNEERYPSEQIRLGAKVYRLQCSVCHTQHGVNGLTHLTATWTESQRRMNIAKLQHTKNFMPPFAGPPEEVEALVQWLAWVNAHEPSEWPISNDPDVLEQIAKWLHEASDY
ncbi:MAG: cytochrome c [Planctomycetaceae bacterium]|nr:cytochrome c [Planctomycetaceae bacterium]